jgi:hypothetical protein
MILDQAAVRETSGWPRRISTDHTDSTNPENHAGIGGFKPVQSIQSMAGFWAMTAILPLL